MQVYSSRCQGHPCLLIWARDVGLKWNDCMWQEKGQELHSSLFSQGKSKDFLRSGSSRTWEDLSGKMWSMHISRFPGPKPQGMFCVVEFAVTLQTLSLETTLLSIPSRARLLFWCSVYSTIQCFRMSKYLLYNVLEWVSMSHCTGVLDTKSFNLRTFNSRTKPQLYFIASRHYKF